MKMRFHDQLQSEISNKFWPSGFGCLKIAWDNAATASLWGFGMPRLKEHLTCRWTSLVGSQLSVIVWESVPGTKSCGQPIWLKFGTDVWCDEIFQKPLWLTSLTSSFGVTRGGLIFCPLSTTNPAFKGAFWKCDKTPLVNCAAKWIWPWTLL